MPFSTDHLERVATTFSRFYEDRDLEIIRRLYHEDAVFISPNPPGIRAPNEVGHALRGDSNDVTEEMCTGVDGFFLDNTGYMVHVWTVPGYESPLGTFSDLNPKLTCPDGTYHRLSVTEIGDAATTCLA